MSDRNHGTYRCFVRVPSVPFLAQNGGGGRSMSGKPAGPQSVLEVLTCPLARDSTVTNLAVDGKFVRRALLPGD